MRAADDEETPMSDNIESLEGYLPAEGRALWNQSFYFNAYDPASRIGCIVRAGFLEGQGQANNWIVFFMDGKPLFQRFNANLPCPAERLADGVDLGGLTLTSVEPLKAARLTLTTKDFAFDLTWRAMHPLIDAVAFGGSGTESFGTNLAHAHLEGSCFVTGSITLRGGKTVAFDGTGGRDIAAGVRDWDGMKHYRVAWPIFPDRTAIIGIHGFAGGRESYMSMVNDGAGWTRMSRTHDAFDFAADEMTVLSTEWNFTDEQGRDWQFTAKPLFRCFLPADTYVLAEHIAEFTRSDGVVGYGLVECGFRLPWPGED